MQQQPLVTVFIPMYNAEAHIRKTLDSILNQTYTNLEVLIVDDGSSDRSVEIVGNYTDDRIRLIRNDGNKGIPFTRNVGLTHAKGKYLAIMDADDESFPERIDKQVAYMEIRPDIDVTGSYYEKTGGGSSHTVKAEHILWQEIRIQVLFSNRFCNSTALIRMDTVKEHGLTYNEDYYIAQDYEFWAQLSKVGRIEILPEVLVEYHTGHSNVTNYSLSKKMHERKTLIDGIHRDLLDHYGFGLTKEEVDVFNNFFFLNVVTVFDEAYVSRIKAVLKKLLDTNEVFDRERFEAVMRTNVLKGMSNSKISLQQKLGLFFDLFREISSEEMFHVLSRHYYKKLKAFL
ncbi:glycosyltransferase family A protein [Salimicrobium sp. PL1-032A]|uniref:glycosyltransferase family 2 protein n=1 Tax=Salimicrobium sp. PL1-032A TaxID=3095364 RepID=UPI00325FFF3A